MTLRDRWLNDLQERFCVLFFMPIYFFGVTLAFLASWIGVIRSNRKSNTFATAIPLLVMFLSLEGTMEITQCRRWPGICSRR